MVSFEADILNKHVNKYILSPHQQIVRLFYDRGSLEGAIKTIIGTKYDLVFLYLILHIIQWQASHGNWSFFANNLASFE
jgi:hypothetical protein